MSAHFFALARPGHGSLILSILGLAFFIWSAGPVQAREAAEAQGHSGVNTDILLKATSSWNGVPYTAYPAGPPELTLVRITIPAKAELGWHTHPMPNVAYVVRGELTVIQRDDGQTLTLTAGQTLPEMVGLAHRGRAGPEPVELLVFYAGSPGLPLSEAAQ